MGGSRGRRHSRVHISNDIITIIGLINLCAIDSMAGAHGVCSLYADSIARSYKRSS